MVKIESYGALASTAFTLGMLVVLIVLPNTNSNAVVAINSTSALQPGTNFNVTLIAEITGLFGVLAGGIVVLGKLIDQWLRNRRYDKEWGYSLP